MGKSTLVNQLVGKKVSIISPKRQTTRQRIPGVKTTKEMQVILLDTPGVSVPRHLLGKKMLEHFQGALVDCDVCLFMVQATHPEPQEEDIWAYRRLKSGLGHRNPPPPVYLVVNKVDKIKNKRDLLPVLQSYSSLGNFSEVFPVSALKGENLDRLEHALMQHLPQGPLYFPEDGSAGGDEKFHVAELIREKILYAVHEEVPHGVAVSVEEIRPGLRGKALYIQATIYVQRNSHRSILIGEGGKMLKRIGMQARKELSDERHQPVYLDLWVKVKKEWQEREDLLNLFGYS